MTTRTSAFLPVLLVAALGLGACTPVGGGGAGTDGGGGTSGENPGGAITLADGSEPVLPPDSAVVADAGGGTTPPDRGLVDDVGALTDAGPGPQDVAPSLPPPMARRRRVAATMSLI